MKRVTYALPFLASVLCCLSGCTVGPNYKRPAAPAVTQWQIAPDRGITAAAQTKDDWWNAFNDQGLSSLIERAIAANYDLRQATARVNEARAGLRSSQSGLFPQISAKASASRDRIRVVAAPNASSHVIVPAEINDFQGGFDASWEVDVFGRIRREVEAAHGDLAASEQDRRDVLVTLLGEVARFYSDLRGTQLRLSIVQHNVEIETTLVDLTRSRAVAGLATELDVARATAQLETVTAQVPALNSFIAADIHRLGVLLGQPPQALSAELMPVAQLPALPPEIPAGMPSGLLLRRPDIQRVEAQLAAQNARIGLAKAEYFPRFSLTGSAGREASQLHDLTLGSGNIFSAGPSVSLPVFTAGRIKANVSLERARYSEVESRYQATVLTAFEETDNALTNYANEQNRLKNLSHAERQQARALELARVQYTAGLADFLTVLDAERELYVTQDLAAQSSTAVVVDAVALYKALGGGWKVSPSAPVR